MGPIFAIVLSLLAIFLILLVLVQRGRGGGLAGALGGMGGSSAFGAKAGDVFTRITIITASIWIVFCLVAYQWAKHKGDVLGAAPVATSSESADTGMLPGQKGTQPNGSTAPGESKGTPASGPVLPESPPAAATPPASPPADDKK